MADPVDPGAARVGPAPWLAELVKIKPAAFPVGHSIRSGLAVGGPFVLGSLTGDILVGMWIGLATLLLAAGEREGTYRLNFTIIAVSTPIAAAGYLVGFMQGMPLAILIVCMALLALICGLISGLGPAFSVGGMQFLLVASIAIGVPGINWWQPLWLYFVGAVIYAALLAVELMINPVRPQRIALMELLDALADLAQARHDDLTAGGDRSARAGQRAGLAYRQAAAAATEFATPRIGSARAWTLDSDVVSAAERVQAFIIGETDPLNVARMVPRLIALARLVDGQHAERTPIRSAGQEHSLLAERVDDLDRAVRAGADGRARHERLISGAIGPEVTRAALRLALCFAIAVGAKAYFPYSHWFWVPLTVALVMKPDFGSVFSRALLRIIGTIVGVALATVVILVVPKGVGIGIVIGLLAAFIPWFMMRSYALQAVAIAPVVILLVDVISPGDSANYSWQRIAATAIGGVVVIVFGYLIWPHSRRAWIHTTFAAAMDSTASYLHLAASASDGDAQQIRTRHDELVGARRAAARSLSDLHTRLQRALSEPAPAGTVARAWIPIVAAADRLSDDVTVYATQRVSGELRPDPADGDAVAAAIRALGSGTASRTATVTGPALLDIRGDVEQLRSLLIGRGGA